MKMLDAISWVLVAPLVPLFKALAECPYNKNSKERLVLHIYGYLVATGFLFNLVVLVAFFIEVLS